MPYWGPCTSKNHSYFGFHQGAMVSIYMHMLDGGFIFYNKLYFQLYLIFMKSIFSRLNPLNINMNIHIYIRVCGGDGAQ